MTSRDQPAVQTREWFLASIVVLATCANIGSQYWGTAAESHVTASQVIALTEQSKQLSADLRELSSKMPRAADVAALATRLDKAEGTIGDIKGSIVGLRSDVDNLQRPITFRNPK